MAGENSPYVTTLIFQAKSNGSMFRLLPIHLHGACGIVQQGPGDGRHAYEAKRRRPAPPSKIDQNIELIN